MTSTYTPESATYAWSESDRQYGRPYPAPEQRPGWYDGYGPIDRPNIVGRPAPVVAGASSSLRKTATVAALVAGVAGGALLGTFVFAKHDSAPSPSVYMLPENSGVPAAPPAPAALPPAPNTIVVPGPTSTRTVIVPPANRRPAPVAVPAPPAVAPAAPKPANVPPPPPPPPPAQVRIEGIPIPFPVAQVPAAGGQNTNDQKTQNENTQNEQKPQGPDECTTVPDLPYCKKTDTSGTAGGSTSGGSASSGGAGGSDPSTSSGGAGGSAIGPNATDPGQFDPAKPRSGAGQSEVQFPSGDPSASTATVPCLDGQSLRNC